MTEEKKAKAEKIVKAYNEIERVNGNIDNIDQRLKELNEHRDKFLQEKNIAETELEELLK